MKKEFIQFFKPLPKVEDPLVTVLRVIWEEGGEEGVRAFLMEQTRYNLKSTIKEG